MRTGSPCGSSAGQVGSVRFLDGIECPSVPPAEGAVVSRRAWPRSGAASRRASRRCSTPSSRGGAPSTPTSRSRSARCASSFAAGGKRLRPAFCHWAFVGAGGAPDDPVVVDAGAALELLHTFALVHDDVMDGSDQRRGSPAVHRRFIDRHDVAAAGAARPAGSARARRSSSATSPSCTPTSCSRSAPDGRPAVFDELRIELCVGQYLDLVGTASGEPRPGAGARASSATSRASTPSSGRCTSAPRSPAGSTSSPTRSARSACRSARRSSCATTCSACSATRRHRQAGRRRPARGQAHAARRRGRRARRPARRRACSRASAGPTSTTPRSPACRRARRHGRRRRDRAQHRAARRAGARRARRGADHARGRAALEELGTFVAWRDR